MTHHLELLRREPIAEGTSAFHFRKPDGFSFKAGQYIDMALVNPLETDAEGNIRTFSIASAPEESELIFATRMRDTAFKRVLGSMPAGAAVEAKGPAGSFTLHQNSARPAVFLVGGIGITPFRSMALDAADRKLPHKIFLFYSNRRPEDAPFLDELRALEERNPNYRFIPTVTEDARRHDVTTSGVRFETGYIDEKMIKKYGADQNNPIYYSAGPLAFVTAMRDLLDRMGVSDDDIRTEEFAGY